MQVEAVEAAADKDGEALMSPHQTIVARSIAADPNYVKCPRCWHYHTVLLNYDALCDRCCQVILEGFPDHASVPFIRANQEAQRRHFNRPTGHV